MNTRKFPRIGILGAGLAVTALALTACSGGAGGAGGDGRDSSTVVLYSSANETTNGVYVDAATALDPSLKVDVVTGSTGPLLQRIQSEASSPASDVFYGAPKDTLNEQQDFLEPYLSPEADGVPEEFVDPDGRWAASNIEVVTFMANTDQIDGGTAPTTWEELADPEWSGKIIAADPTQSTTALTAFYGAYKVLGEEKFKDLAANVEITENSSNVYPAVAQGEYAVTIGYESNIYPYIAGGQAGIEMIYPEDGTFVADNAAIITKDAPNLEEAKRLVDLILSKEVQEQMLEQSYKRPSRDDIDVSEFVDFLPLDDINLIETDGEEDEQGHEDFLELWDSL